jgi:hypothetical protein
MLGQSVQMPWKWMCPILTKGFCAHLRVAPTDSFEGAKQMPKYSKRIYLNRWWRELWWYVINDRAGGICERCHKEPAVQVHHLVYPIGRREQARDLMAVCDACHYLLHHPPANDNDPPAANDNQPQLYLAPPIKL